MFRFKLPKDFLPQELSDKYTKYLNLHRGVITSPIEFLNESIQGITIPGMTDLVLTQEQHSTNGITRGSSSHGLGRINIEPKTDITYKGPDNPLDRINKEFRVTFRINQSLVNYFMIFETIFYRACKPLDHPSDPVFTIDIMNELGDIVAKLHLYDVHIDGLEGIEFDYSKLERQGTTFDVTFKFNNLDYEFDMVHDRVETED